MPDCGGYSTDVYRSANERRRPGVGRGKGRGVTKPPLRKRKRRR